jgi:hypothetical protein
LAITYTRANKWAGWIFGGTVSSLLLFVAYQNREWLLERSSAVAVILLSLSATFMIWLIGALIRFHERTVADSAQRHKALLGNAIVQMDTVWKLSTAFGMAQQGSNQIYQLDNPLSVDQMRYLDSNIRELIAFHFDTRKEQEDFYRARPAFPKEGESQVHWINTYCVALEKLIEKARSVQMIHKNDKTLKQVI